MVRFTASTAVVALLAISAAAAASPPKNSPPGQAQSQQASNQVLMDGLKAIAATLNGNGQQPSLQAQPNSVDHDQGDDHASDVAISKVCNHDNPSATHSAICPKPNSPP